jgi:hypothetical protein
MDAQWLIVAIWGAATWVRFEGRLLQDFSSDAHGRPAAWTSESDEVSRDLFRCRHFVDFKVTRTSLHASLDDGRLLALAEAPSDRPVSDGSGQPRALEPGDDLRKVVFLCPTENVVI